MRFLTFFLLLILAAIGVPAAAEPLTQGERDRAMSYLHATRKQFLDATAGLSEAQWRYKQAPERWSVAEVAEHIALTEDFLFGIIQDRVLKQPATPEKKEERRKNDSRIAPLMTDRSQRAQAPERLQPAGKWPNRDAVAEAFKERRDRTIAFIRDTQTDLRAHATRSQVFGELDAYQWILYIAAHSERHIQQIEEVKAGARRRSDEGPVIKRGAAPSSLQGGR
jgi:hypothetical protein